MSGEYSDTRRPWVTDVDETMTENNISLFYYVLIADIGAALQP